MHILRPLSRSTALVERLPWNRLANGDAERLVHILVHFINEVDHCDVDLLDILIAEISQFVEEIGILTAK